MKKMIRTLFVMSISFNAFANKVNSDFKNLKFEQNASYTCTYEYYEEVVLAGGDIVYVFIRSEIVECEAENAGKIFKQIGRQGGHM